MSYRKEVQRVVKVYTVHHECTLYTKGVHCTPSGDGPKTYKGVHCTPSVYFY